MSQPTSYDRRRLYAGEKYIRAESLLQGGKFVSVVWEIVDIVYACPFKKMGAKAGEDATTKGLGVEFREAPGFVLGLGAATNVSMIALTTGEGHPPKWIGKKVRLCVRLIADRKTKTDIPCIRVWTEKPVKIGRIAEQLGRMVDDEWYKANTMTDGSAPPNEPEKKQEPPKPANHDGEVAALCLGLQQITDDAGLDSLRPEVTRLWPLIDAAAKKLITTRSDEAKARIAPKPAASGEPTDDQTALANKLATDINATVSAEMLKARAIDVADYLKAGELTAHQAEALQGMIESKLPKEGT